MGYLSKKEEVKFVNEKVEQLSIKIGSMEDDTSSLSGGNQQKVAIAKLLASNCKVLILDEPTRGVDVGAKREIYKIINDFAEKEYSIVMISSEMPEIMGMCDRVIVMRGGEITGELRKEDLTENNLIALSMGCLLYTSDSAHKINSCQLCRGPHQVQQYQSGNDFIRSS